VFKLLPLVRPAGLAPGAHPVLALARLRQDFLLDGQGTAAAADAHAATRNAAAVCAELDDVLALGPPVRGLAHAGLRKLLAADEPTAAFPAPATDAEGGVAWPPTGVKYVALAARILVHAHQKLCIGLVSACSGGVVGVRASAQRFESEMRALRLGGVRNVREFR
jgi:hypothetical protein